MVRAKWHFEFRPRCFWKRASAGIGGFVLLQGLWFSVLRAESDVPLRLRPVELAEKAGPANEAERVYKLALEADPALEMAHLGLAQMWMNRREFVRSLEVIERGLESNPGSVPLLLLKADALSQRERSGLCCQMRVDRDLRR